MPGKTHHTFVVFGFGRRTSYSLHIAFAKHLPGADAIVSNASKLSFTTLLALNGEENDNRSQSDIVKSIESRSIAIRMAILDKSLELLKSEKSGKIIIAKLAKESKDSVLSAGGGSRKARRANLIQELDAFI